MTTDKRLARVFGARLREARHARGLTQTQLAAEAATSREEVLRLEKGTAGVVGLGRLVRLADALGVTTDWLAGRTTTGGPRRTYHTRRS